MGQASRNFPQMLRLVLLRPLLLTLLRSSGQWGHPKEYQPGLEGNPLHFATCDNQTNANRRAILFRTSVFFFPLLFQVAFEKLMISQPAGLPHKLAWIVFTPIPRLPLVVSSVFVSSRRRSLGRRVPPRGHGLWDLGLGRGLHGAGRRKRVERGMLDAAGRPL